MSFLCPPGSRRGLEDYWRILDQGHWGAPSVRGDGNYLSGLQDNSAVTQPGVLARMGFRRDNGSGGMVEPKRKGQRSIDPGTGAETEGQRDRVPKKC